MRRVSLVVLAALTTACAARTTGILVPVPPPAAPVATLVEQLSSPDAATRASAAWSLAGAGTVADDVMRALVLRLDDPEPKVHEAATWALGHLKSPGVKPPEVDIPPRPETVTKPEYPGPAFHGRTQGTVDVEILIDAQGQVVHAEVRRSVRGLDEAARACVRAWSFAPAQRGGKPVAAVAFAPVTFRIY